MSGDIIIKLQLNSYAILEKQNEWLIYIGDLQTFLLNVRLFSERTRYNTQGLCSE